MDSGIRSTRIVSILPLLLLATVPCFSKQESQTPPQVLMVSDVHFEPFWDPGKAAQLAGAPESDWADIFSSDPSPDREAQFNAMQQACHTRGQDTSYPLFVSSLKAIKSQAAGAKFMTVSGDLISHGFSCKFAQAFPKAKNGDYRVFVEKTIKYVMNSLRSAVPGVKVYPALGNNDSDCGDYQLDANSSFLNDLDKEFTADIPPIDMVEARADFPIGGNYSTTLPKPFANVRLIVLDDLFLARKYQTCAGKDDASEASRQLAWMQAELDRARLARQKVWIMAHIPPGIDAHATVAKGKSVCDGQAPTMFLSSDDFPNVLAQYGDVISLAVFAHTHMDEMRLLLSNVANSDHAVPVKLVSSISPVDGNNPSFTVAQVDPRTGTVVNYRVVAASNQTGIDTTWKDEYDFATAYGQPAFSDTALTALIGDFRADTGAKSPASQSYIRNYFVGDRSSELTPFWPIATCGLTNMSADNFRNCVCSQ